MSLNELIKIKEDTSPAFKVDLTDMKKLGRDAAIVGGAAAIAYMISHIGSVNFGDYSAFLVPIVSTVLTLAYKWFKDNSPE